MADLGELKVPVAMRSVAGVIIALTDEMCAELLDQEYAILARMVVATKPYATAFGLGVIPYIPALGRDGTAEWSGRGGGA